MYVRLGLEMKWGASGNPSCGLLATHLLPPLKSNYLIHNEIKKTQLISN